MKRRIKIVFFGTSDFSVRILEGLLANGYEIAMAVTQPDKKAGRKQKIIGSPVKRFTETEGVKIFQPDNLKEKSVFRELKSVDADVFIVASYGNILPKELLDLPKFGSINLHASLLPKYRGASPVQSAILSGDNETGVTLMLMNEKMDEGDIINQKKISIGKNDTAVSLMEKLGTLGENLILESLPKWINGKINAQKQNSSEATYCGMIRRENGQIDWSRPAEKIFRQWRALQPWPGVYTYLNEKNRNLMIKLNRMTINEKVDTGEKPGKVVQFNQEIGVQAGSGIVILESVQMEGKRDMAIGDFIKGHHDFLSSILINNIK